MDFYQELDLFKFSQDNTKIQHIFDMAKFM